MGGIFRGQLMRCGGGGGGGEECIYDVIRVYYLMILEVSLSTFSSDADPVWRRG